MDQHKREKSTKSFDTHRSRRNSSKHQNASYYDSNDADGERGVVSGVGGANRTSVSLNKTSMKNDNDDLNSSLAIFGVEDDGLMEAIHQHLNNYNATQTPRKTRSTATSAFSGPQHAFYPCPPPENEEYAPEVEREPNMYGRYSKDLSQYAKSEAKRLEKLRRESPLADVDLEQAIPRDSICDDSKCLSLCVWVWKNTFARLGEDWVFLALLGVIMAVLSFIMDRGISMCNNARLWLYRDLTKEKPLAQYASFVLLPLFLILFSTGFVQIVAPQSIGSGIPEMKTILRGVSLKEYLTLRTLIAKVVGLTATLGAGLPLGKEGPFVHIASIVATLCSKLITGFQGIYDNESRNCVMLSAACAVGVASCFAAPVGGVLFSIEVTSTYFAVRNYWRAFFAAVCGATVFRLLSVWFEEAHTVTAMFRTSFAMDFPFDPQELFIFSLLGVICGFGGALYVYSHRQYVLFMRSSQRLNNFLQTK